MKKEGEENEAITHLIESSNFPMLHAAIRSHPNIFCYNNTTSNTIYGKIQSTSTENYNLVT